MEQLGFHRTVVKFDIENFLKACSNVLKFRVKSDGNNKHFVWTIEYIDKYFAYEIGLCYYVWNSQNSDLCFCCNIC
jgi:hypothetical protein